MDGPSFYVDAYGELKPIWDDDRPSYAAPMALVVIVLLVAVVVYCMCKRAPREACGACTSAKAAVASSGPVHIKSEAHHDELTAREACVVLYYAPWCGHCQQMKPAFVQAANEHPDVTYAMLDCENTVGMPFLQKHGIEGFPTIRMFPGGKEYEGDRSKESIVAWARA